MKTFYKWILEQIKCLIIRCVKGGAFGGTYFRDNNSKVTRKWHRKSWKEFNQLKSIVHIITMLVLINLVLTVEHR